MMINILVFAGVLVWLFLTVIVIIFAYKSKPKKNMYKLDDRDKEKFLNDSIAIQPNNSVIFKDKTIDEVIDSGFAIMDREKYKMLKEVDQNGL